MNKTHLVHFLMMALLSCQSSTVENQKDYFDEDEYGILHWDAEGDWQQNWRFKPETELASIEIVLLDQDNHLEVLVEKESANNLQPLEFGFRLNPPKLTGSDSSPNLSIPFGFSRIAGMEGNSMGLSSWAQIDGNAIIETTYNQEPRLGRDDKIILATYRTTDGNEDFSYTIELRYAPK